MATSDQFSGIYVKGVVGPLHRCWNFYTNVSRLEIVSRTINCQRYRRKKTHENSGKLLIQYSPDALIQTAHDRLGCKDEKFFEILSNELYEYFPELLLLMIEKTVLLLYVTDNKRHDDPGQCQADDNSRKEQIALPVCRHQ